MKNAVIVAAVRTAVGKAPKGSLRTVLSKAVYAAYKRAVDLGQKK